MRKVQGNVSKNLMLAQCIKVKVPESESLPQYSDDAQLVLTIIDDIIADVELM